MRSSNPVFARSEQFATQQQTYGQQGYGQPTYDAQPQGYGQPYGAPQTPPPAGVMTIDDVITKSAIMMGLVFLVAALTFLFLPISLVTPVALASGLMTFVVVLFVSFRRQISPAFVGLFSIVEGVFVGAFSAMFNYLYDGIVVQAVLATFVAAAATLAAYKFLRIKVTSQFRKIITIGTFAFAGLVLVNLGLALFGVDTGLRGIGAAAGPLAWIISIVALFLAVANLIMDFDYIEQGVRNRLPASESWRAAFGLTVTMVWLYTEILRVLSYFRSN